MTPLVPVDAPSVVAESTPSPALVHLAQLSPTGRRSQLHALNTMASILSNNVYDAVGLPWVQLRLNTPALRTALTDRYAAATVNRCLAAFRGVLRECFQLGFMDADTLQCASKLSPIKASPLPMGRALGNSEIRAMFATCDDDTTPAGVRDAALFAMLYGADLRCADWSDWTWTITRPRMVACNSLRARATITCLSQALRAGSPPGGVTGLGLTQLTQCAVLY